MPKWIAALSAVLILTGATGAARAGERLQAGDPGYWPTRDAIYALVNHIAYLEADPDIDDAVKGPLITADRAEIHRLRATIGAPPWKYPSPCCYSRRPLFIR